MSFHIVIPARFQSTRLPGKLLMPLQGVSILERVYRQACLAKPLSITIATDSEVIAHHAQGFGAQVRMTASSHQSGTDRLAELVEEGVFAAEDILVNVQGDEPFIDPLLIKQVAGLLKQSQDLVATLCWPIESLAQLQNPNVVKVVFSQDSHALYFSRSPIPLHRDQQDSFEHSFKHIGLYAYRASFLQDFVGLPVCELERHESLEQLRILWAGIGIKMAVACVAPLQDINTKEDLILAQALCKHI